MSRPLLVFLTASYFAAIGAIPSNAQNAQSTQPGETAQSTTPIATAPTAAKKIWTNDDLSGSYIDGVTSASSRPSPASSVHTTRQPSKKNAVWYSDQITKLQAQIPPLDAQIAVLHSAIDGKPTGDAKKSVRPYSVRADDWTLEMNQLSEKRDHISSQIAALRDEARRSGVSANALP
jgi:hypothetical protein